MLLLTLRGTPTIYYGDEIGMQDVPIAPHQVQDPQEKNIPGIGLGRDPERTPMQWDNSPNAGFTEAEPWLPLMENYEQINVKKEREEKDSMLNFYRKLIQLRQSEPALKTGEYIPVFTEGNLLAYRREKGKKFLIALNLGSSPEVLNPDISEWRGKVKISTHPESEGEKVSGELRLKANEGLLISLE